MPKNPIKQKDVNDKFYTKPEVAFRCLENLVSIKNITHKTIIEPSAGNGSFIEAISRLDISVDLKCFDLLPEHDSIIKQDFLLLSEDYKKEEPIFIGNPPFGLRNKTTDLFIKKCISLNAETIAFILPKVYCKFNKQKVFPKDYKLIFWEDLPENSFTFQGEDYHIPSVFMIWNKSHIFLPDLREKEFTTCADFEILKPSNKNEADLFSFGSAPQNLLDPTDVLPNNRGYFLKSHIDKELLKYKLKNIDWKQSGKSSVNGGVFWLTKSEFYQTYIENQGEIK